MGTRLLLRPEPGAVFTVRGAALAGVSRGRIDRHPEVRAPFPGVRIRVKPIPEREGPWETRRRTVLQLANAYRAVMPQRVFFSHATAAEIYGATLPLPGSADEYDLTCARTSMTGLLEAATLAPHRSPRATVVTAHQVMPELCTVIEYDGYRVSDPASTWAMLADRLTVEQLVVLGDSFVRRDRIAGTSLAEAPPAMATIDELRTAMDAGPRTGVARLRAALPLIRQGASSDLETLQRLAMRDAGLPEPELDVDVYDDTGKLLGCTEIVYSGRKIAIECEGDHHRVSRQQWNRDIEKYHAYMQNGWLVVRGTAQEIRYRRPVVADRARAALLQRGWKSGEPG